MTERRPHWDDDLVLAVAQAHDEMHKPAENATYWTAGCYREDLLYPVIAAVEDWQERKGEENLPLLMAMMNAESEKFRLRAEKAEAAIARVRQVCRDPSKRMLATSHMNVEWVDLNAVLNALEGDSDE